MSGALVLLTVVAPLRLTLWVLAVAGAVIVVLLSIVVAHRLEWVRAIHRREHVQAELVGRIFARFETEDRARLRSWHR